MNTYILTENDIDRLQETFLDRAESLWYNSKMNDWVKTLETSEDRYYCECEDKYLNYICPCAQKQ